MSNTLYRVKNNNIIKTNVKLLYATKAKYEEDWHSTMHVHPFTELFYVVDGSGSFRVEDESFIVEKDDLVIVNSNIPHTESSKDSNPLEYIVLGIEGMSLKENIHPYTTYSYGKYRHKILFYLNNILYEVENEGKYYETICQNLLDILILNIIRQSKSNIILSPTKNISKECAYIKKYIDTNYSLDLTLDSLSSVAYMDKYYLARVFKKYVGTSPIDYIIEKRISVSKILLETTDYSMGQISEIVGFNSQSYFNQIFKKRIGITPTEYRKTSAKLVENK